MRQANEAADPQQFKTYAWEDDAVEPYCVEHLSREECLSLISRASIHAGIRLPETRFTKMGFACKAHPAKHAITLASWGRTRVAILHEIAHLQTAMDCWRSGQGGHGPIFVRAAIDLYERFIGIPAAKLEQKARAFGLEISPRATPVQVASRRGNDFFADDF